MEINNILAIVLLMNSFALLFLIFNQNDSTKESISNQNVSSVTNPFENITWILVNLEFILLLIKIKKSTF